MVGDGKGETASGRSARRFLNSAESPLMALSHPNPCFLRKSQILSRRPLRSEISKIMSGRSWFLRCMTVACEWPASTHIHCLNPLQPYLTRLDRSNSPYQTNWWDDVADIRLVDQFRANPTMSSAAMRTCIPAKDFSASMTFSKGLRCIASMMNTESKPLKSTS